jgi:hypothetical protein
MVVTTHPHLVARLKKKLSYTFTSPLGLCGLLQGELYVYVALILLMWKMPANGKWDLTWHVKG